MIKGLTDGKRIQAGGGLPVLARIKKGLPPDPDGGRNYPVDLDYLRIEWGQGFEHLNETAVQLWGDKPQRLHNMLIFGHNNTVEGVFPSIMRLYGKGNQLKRVCDHETIYREFNPQTNNLENVQKQCEAGSDNAGCKCNPYGTLRLIPIDLIERTGEIGLFVMTLHSWREVPRIFNYLTTMRDVIGLSLQLMPITIYRADESIKVPDQRMNVDKSLVFIKVKPEYMIGSAANKRDVIEANANGMGINAGNAAELAQLLASIETGDPDVDDDVDPEPEEIEADVEITEELQIVVDDLQAAAKEAFGDVALDDITDIKKVFRLAAKDTSDAMEYIAECGAAMGLMFSCHEYSIEEKPAINNGKPYAVMITPLVDAAATDVSEIPQNELGHHVADVPLWLTLYKNEAGRWRVKAISQDYSK